MERALTVDSTGARRNGTDTVDSNGARRNGTAIDGGQHWGTEETERALTVGSTGARDNGADTDGW